MFKSTRSQGLYYIEYDNRKYFVSTLYIQALMRLKHPHIVRLHEVIREENQLYLVFEYMRENLYEMIKHRTKPFLENTVQNITYQVMLGLAFMHKQGLFI